MNVIDTKYLIRPNLLVYNINFNINSHTAMCNAYTHGVVIECVL